MVPQVDSAHAALGDQTDDRHASDIAAEKGIVAGLGRLNTQSHREALQA